MQVKVVKGNIIRFLGKSEKILVNPDKEVVESPKYGSRIVVFTGEKYDFLGLGFDGVVIRGPGEYEVGGVEISGVDANGDGVVYLVNLDGVMVAVVESLSKEVGNKLVDKVKGVDVLVLLAEEGGKVDSKAVLAVAKKWGVNYLIPVGFTEEKLKVLLDVVDREDLEPVPSLKVEKDSLPDGMEVVLLSSK